MKTTRKPVSLSSLAVLITFGVGLGFGVTGCGSDGGEVPPDQEGIPHFTVTGTVLDFATRESPGSQATITTDGLQPAPTVVVNGSEFVISDIPLQSVFNVLAGSPPSYRSTYNPAIVVEESNVDGVETTVVSEQYLAQLAEDFGVQLESGTTVLIGRLVDEGGSPQAGIPGEAFALDPSVVGPFFLDAERNADPELGSSSESGYFVLFDVPTGLMRVTAAQGSDYGMTMADSPVATNAVTIADIIVGAPGTPGGGGPGELPTNVSYSRDVAPAFIRRGCDACHDGGGIGKDLGGLHLNGADEKMYRELTQEISQRHQTTRVNLAAPEQSLVLTMPSREDPPDIHPNITFASPDDPDYKYILAWIIEGALNN